jgi:predicted PurR-regulated permease PerM
MHTPQSTFVAIHHILFFLLITAGLCASLVVLWPFLSPIFWALIFAIILFPVQTYIIKKANTISKGRITMGPTLASLCTMLFFLTCILVPLVYISSAITEEAQSLYHDYYTKTPYTQTAVITYTTDILHTWGIQTPDNLSDTVSSATTFVVTWLGAQAFSLGTATLVTLVYSIIMLYLLFFMLRDGEKAVRYIRHILPLGHEREKSLFVTFTSITRAIVKGTLIVALVQGCIGGILFAVAGVPHVFLATALMTLLACIPGVGPALVWLPVGVGLLLTDNVAGGTLVLLGGAFIISLVDNIVRPLLVGRDTSLPDPIIFISILGGIASFGLAGVIIGPVIAGLCMALLKMFGDEYRTELEKF